MKNNTMMIAVAVAVVAGGIGFFGGIKYEESKVPAFGTGRSVQAGANFGTFGTGQGRTGGTRANGFRPITGDIISSDDKSITVKLTDGSSKIIFLSGTTQINKASTGVQSDLTVGEKVMIFGQTNADGSVTAQNIQLNPQERMMLGSPTSSPSAMQK